MCVDTLLQLTNMLALRSEHVLCAMVVLAVVNAGLLTRHGAYLRRRRV